MNTVADPMSHHRTTGGDNTEKPIDVEVPIPAIECGVNTKTLKDHEIGIPDTNQGRQTESFRIHLPRENANRKTRGP